MDAYSVCHRTMQEPHQMFCRCCWELQLGLGCLASSNGALDIYVAPQGTPSALGVPYHINHIIYSHFTPFLRRHASDAPSLKHVILFVDVTSFNDTVTSQHHTCIGQVTIYYKRATNTLVGGVSVSLLVH